MDEAYGEGNLYDYGFRIYDSRIGRFLSVDPLFQKFPFYTPYQFASNSPIGSSDLDGAEGQIKIHVNTDQLEVAIKNKNAGQIIAEMGKILSTPAYRADLNGKKVLPFSYNIGEKSDFLTVADKNNNVLFTINNFPSRNIGDENYDDSNPGGWTLTTGNPDANSSWTRRGDVSGSINIDGLFVGAGAAPTLKGAIGGFQWIMGIIGASYDAGDKIGELINQTLEPKVPTLTYPDSLSIQNKDSRYYTFDRKTGAPVDTYITNPEEVKMPNGQNILEYENTNK